MISVAMTTCNGEKYVRKQLDSIMNQSMQVDEIVICDDCSHDRTVEIVKEYPVQLFVNETNLGFKQNFRKAMELCHGDYIFLCDQDDIWELNKVEKMIGVIQKHPEIHVVSSAFRLIDAEDRFIDNGKKRTLYPYVKPDEQLVSIPFDSLVSINYFQGAALLMDRWIMEEALANYDTRIEHDWLICMLAASYGSLFLYNFPLFRYRLHQANQIGISSEGESGMEHFVKTNEETVRKQAAYNAINVISIVKNANIEYYQNREKWFEGIESFCTEHIQMLESRNILGLLKENFSPYYGVIKTRKARIMYIIFAIMRRKTI